VKLTRRFLKMPKLHKLRKRQKFSYQKNRKRVKKSQELTKKSNIKVSW